MIHIEYESRANLEEFTWIVKVRSEILLGSASFRFIVCLCPSVLKRTPFRMGIKAGFSVAFGRKSRAKQFDNPHRGKTCHEEST